MRMSMHAACSRLLPGSRPAEIRTIATFWVVSERSNVKLAFHDTDTDILRIVARMSVRA